MKTAPLLDTLSRTAAEMCLKMGSVLPCLRLNLPVESVKRLLQADTLEEALAAIAAECPALEAEPFENAVCFTLGEEDVKAAYSRYGSNPFLKELIALSGSHHASLEDWLSFFRSHGEATVEPAEGGEFACLVYYPSGQPDSNLYCLAVEADHVTYHRFSREEYEAL